MSHYKPYPAYRDSGVEWIGSVPAHWQIKRLKYAIASCRNGVWGDDPTGNNDTLCVRVADFDRETLRINPEIPTLRAIKGKERADRLLRRGNLLLEKSGGGERQPVGQVVLYDRDDEAVCANFIARIELISSSAPSYWCYQFAAAYSCGLNIRSVKQTSGIQNLDQEQYLDEMGVFPPTDEQESIAISLDRETARIDALIAKKTRFIELLKEKRQALITHAVTKGLDPNVKMRDSGVEWIGEVPEVWTVGRLRDFCSSISTGPFGTALGVNDYVENGIPVINPSHMIDGVCVPDRNVSVTPETADRLAYWLLREGDLVVARRGELGRAAVVTREEHGWICGTGSLRLTPIPDKASTSYLYLILQSLYARAWLDRESVGSTMANLNETLVGNVPVAIPPSLDEQELLLARLHELEHQLDNIARKTQRSIDLLKERRSALITAAVTGQIDLREAS